MKNTWNSVAVFIGLYWRELYQIASYNHINLIEWNTAFSISSNVLELVRVNDLKRLS